MTATVTTAEGQVCVFVAIVHWNSECVGIQTVLNAVISDIAVTFSVAWRR
jgi:hypothetical protein